MELTSISALQQDLVMVRGKIENCDKKLAELHPTFVSPPLPEAQRLQDARTYLEAVRARISTALDLVTGRAFTVKDNGEVQVFQPEPNLAKLLKAAEESGARISEVIPIPK
jgi:hypothetical protein